MGGPRVVVIGAGVVGAAVADELSSRGWTDITVVEQGPLFATGGSTSHAPGLVFQCNGSRAMTELATYTVDKFVSLDLDGQPCFLQVGGLEVATTPQRLAELHRRHGWLTAWGVEARVVSPAEVAKLHRLVDPDAVLGGLHIPTDGLAKGVRAVQAQARAAQDRGARFLEHCEVLDIVTEAGEVTGVVTTHGDVRADVVVCCAGIWGPRIAAMIGMTLPLTPLAHQLAWTGPVAPLQDQQTEALRPILRHQDHDLYYRDDADRLAIGYYGHRPMPIKPEEIPRHDEAPVMPTMLEFTPEDFEPAWQESRRLLPALREAEIAEGTNGLFSFTTDGMPLVGESTDVKGFWVAEAVWVTHSAGVGRAVAEWLVDGAPSIDMHECDVNRFEPHQLTPDYVHARDCQNFVEVYDILHPLQPMEEPRPMRTSPFYPRQQGLGATFLEANGWERPQWYAANAAELRGRDIPTPGAWAGRYWSPIVGAEAEVTRERVAMYDMSALKRLEIAGNQATAYLQRMVTGNIDKSIGSVTYTLLLDERGRIRSDITVARLAAERFQIGANGHLDQDWLRRHLPADSTITIRDLTAGTCCVGLWGPHARDVIHAVSHDDFSNEALRFFRAKHASIGVVPVVAMRVSYVGELGWELYTTADQGLRLWDTLWSAGQEYGVIAGGRGAFNSLRLEKGYRAFGADMTWDHNPYEAGVGFAVRMDKDGFIGQHALRDLDPDAASRKLTCLTGTDPRLPVMGKEPVYDGDRCVGYVTSAAWGYTLNLGIAYAWLPAKLSEPGSEVQIGYFDERIPMMATPEPLFDPQMTRLRG